MNIRDVVILVVLALLVVLSYQIFLSDPTWDRPNPLVDAIEVVGVGDGVISLVDGRRLIPGGIQRREGVDQEQFDFFLRIATAQGVVIDRMIDEERAFLRVEPMFYNWCGTSQRDLNWAGSYAQCPLSELAIIGLYGDPDAGQDGLTDQERWRLDGAVSLRLNDEVEELNESDGSFRYDSIVYSFRHLDESIESMTDTGMPKP